MESVRLIDVLILDAWLLNLFDERPDGKAIRRRSDIVPESFNYLDH